ncbi:hypothetical protein [Actinopolyspora halophila]|uniref:hypothetical protein n=1 Tax=Actinopolyspora halophila TaxID=1850 RepID=UPI0003618A2C|nr:hypothetical protein [Actinopolyspora halophila]
MSGRLQRAVVAFLRALQDDLPPPRRTTGRADIGRLEPLIPLDEVPAATEPAAFLGAETDDLVPGYVFLLWDSPVGVLAAAYRTTEKVRTGIPNHVRHHRPDIRVLLTVPDTGFWAPNGPDVHDQPSGHSLGWRYYASAIGRAAPYWPWSLAHRELLEQWQPGDPVVTTAPAYDTDALRLLEMAALYPDDSPVSRVLRYYYARSAEDGRAGHRMCYDAMASEARGEHIWQLAGLLDPAAAAIPFDKPDEPDEDEIRTALAEIISRVDTLSETVVAELCRSTARRYLPFSHTERYRCRYSDSAPLREWRQRLEELPPRQPDARFGGLDRGRGARRFVDPATSAPVERIDHDHPDDETEYVTLLPQRLPTTSPLAEVILDGGDRTDEVTSGDHVWVRTADGTLYPLPTGSEGYAWGYGGTGPTTLTVIVERLLDDITAAPRTRYHRPAAASLERLFQRKHLSGTVLTRDELEHAQQH